MARMTGWPAPKGLEKPEVPSICLIGLCFRLVNTSEPFSVEKVERGSGVVAQKILQSPFMTECSRKVAVLLTANIGIASIAPADALTASEFKGAQVRVEIAMASTPRKYAERIMAPRFPGLRTSSMRRMKGERHRWEVKVR
jgi:hypothetical protein